MVDNKTDKDFLEPGGRVEHPLVQENRILQVRLTLAQAFLGMMHTAYDALLHHSINYRNLPEYSDSTLLDKALGNGVSVEEGKGGVMGYIERVTNGIAAAIRRKGFRKLGPTDSHDRGWPKT